jgi:hypothetical protein
MERDLVIHGSSLGGYGVPGMLAFLGVLGTFAAVLDQIWARRSALVVWLILIGAALAILILVEAVNRRNVVEVKGDRIRWSFRQPPDNGDQPLSALSRVEVFPSGARLVFDGGPVFASRAMFTPRDIRRLVDGLRGLGAQVTQMGGGGEESP